MYNVQRIEMKKTGLTLLSILAAGLLLSGCGSEDGTQQQSGIQTSSISQEQASALAISAQSIDDIQAKYDTNDTEQAIRQLKIDIASGNVTDLQKLLVEEKKENFMKKYLNQLLQSGEISQSEYDEYLQDVDLKEAFDAVMKEISSPISTQATGANRISASGFLSSAKKSIKKVTNKIVDKAKDVVIDLADTKVGNKLTGAVFNLVLEDEGVTVFMLDQARNSETMTQIMIDALGNNWDLTKKMCPMLQENKEFGEKFAALAEERESMAKFFFENIDGRLYNCLGDAMLLSNDDSVHDSSVSHSTTEYMGILMDRYSNFFVAPGSDSSNTSGYGRKDKFVGLMFDTGLPVVYDENTTTYLNHGDGNELANEKFFYALFKTPTSTDKFVSAMEKVDENTRKILMDQIFLGEYNGQQDTIQGAFNIIAIGSGMYEGIYGNGTTSGYGLSKYGPAFLGFAKLIPSDRYMAYAKAFVNAGFEYAQMHNIDVWANSTDFVKNTWKNYISSDQSTIQTSSIGIQSAGRGTLDSEWTNDILTLVESAWDNVSLLSIGEALLSNDQSSLAVAQSEYSKFIGTIIDGTDDNGTKNYPTIIETNLSGSVVTDTVYGFHGLIELAIQEDIANTVYNGNIAQAKEDFVLPPFADLTWEFVYNSAADGISSYWDNQVNAAWLADLSDSSLIKEYFYTDAYALYVPNWMLAFDWLKLPNNVNNTQFADTNFNFQSGYVDVYIVSKNSDLTSDVDLQNAISGLKNNVTFNKVDMGDDSIIAVDANGQNLDGLYVYKLRLISPEDVATVIDYLASLGSQGLAAVGLDTTHAANITQ